MYDLAFKQLSSQRQVHFFWNTVQLDKQHVANVENRSEQWGHTYPIHHGFSISLSHTKAPAPFTATPQTESLLYNCISHHASQTMKKLLFDLYKKLQDPSKRKGCKTIIFWEQVLDMRMGVFE